MRQNDRAEILVRGKLLMIGPFSDPRQGAMGVFGTREAAEEFVRVDQFLLEGVVRGGSCAGYVLRLDRALALLIPHRTRELIANFTGGISSCPGARYDRMHEHTRTIPGG